MTKKHESTKECIEKDLLTIADFVVRQRGRRLSWLSFAKKRTLHGYAFLKQTDNIWDAWEEIMQKTKKIHPEYALSSVAEIASELLNQDENILKRLIIG
jgi:inorganic triphosphatase YgiF